MKNYCFFGKIVENKIVKESIILPMKIQLDWWPTKAFRPKVMVANSRSGNMRKNRDDPNVPILERCIFRSL